MTRHSVTTEDGRSFWFDPSAKGASSWDEDTEWDGKNHISQATGTQWDHEKLHRTPKGAWVLHYWSQWQGKREGYRQVTEAEAAAWLVKCGYDDAAETLLPGEMEATEL